MFKYPIFFSLFLLLPLMSRNQPLPGLSCYDQLYVSTITVFQALNFGGCGALLRIPFQSADVYPTTFQCSGGSQIVRLGGFVYYQWRIVQSVGGIDMTLGSGNYTRPMSDKSVTC